MKTSSKQRKPAAAKPDGAPAAPANWKAIIPQRAPAAALSSLNVPPKWRWHHRVLVALHDRLLRERGELLGIAAEPLEPYSLDEADRGTDEFDHDLALTELAAEQDALAGVNDALRRIQSGTYGVCEATGQAIPAARLKAIPWTRFTQEAEARRERKGVARQTRVNQATTVRNTGQMRLTPEEEPEELAETPPALPNDEALAPVVLAPVRLVLLQKTPRRARRATRKAQVPRH